MAVHTPLIKTQTTEPPEAVDVVPVAVEQPSHGGGWSPPCSGGPANADESSAQTSAPVASSLFKGMPPLLVVGTRGGATARLPHDTPLEPEVYVRWRALLADGLLTEASDFCRERSLTAPSEAAQACHVKDLAIVRRMLGDYEGALNIHVALNLTAGRFGGPFRGRIEHGLARSLQTLRYFDAAFGRYTASRVYHEQGGDLIACAQVDTNIGRCYTEARNPSESHFYFDRAAQIATQFGDFHLLGEIAESRALAYEAERRFEEAKNWAWVSIQLLTQTGDQTAYEESARTYQRVRALTGVAGL